MPFKTVFAALKKLKITLFASPENNIFFKEKMYHKIVHHTQFMWRPLEKNVRVDVIALRALLQISSNMAIASLFLTAGFTVRVPILFKF